MTRRTRPTILLGAALLAASCGGDGPAVDRPHVVLITLDTVRADHLTCYGARTGDTPAIDAIAAEGALFERAVASSGLTPTSHATILTGRFQYEHGLRVLAAAGGYRVDEDVPTLAALLGDAGYRTAAIHSAFPVSATFGFDRGFDHFDSFDADLVSVPGTDKVGWDVRTFQRRSDETTTRALDWVRGALDDDPDRPIFLWLHYWDPHDRELEPPPEEFRDFFYAQVDGLLRDEGSRAYAAEVRWQDRNLGRLFLGLRQMGILDDGVLAVTADHGQGLADGIEYHDWPAHRMLYREQVHVPLVIRAPGVEAGLRPSAQVRTADVAPTILDLVGLDPAALLGEHIGGATLLPLLDGAPAAPDRVAYGEQVSGYDDNAGMRRRRPDAAFMYMVSDGAWKVIYRPHMPERSELFHVAVDFKERRDVRADHPDEYLRLMEDLAARNPWVLEPFQGESHGGGDALTGLGYTAAPQGTGDWWWTCPAEGIVPGHAEGVREDARGECPDCGRILVPVGTWEEPR